MTEREIPAFSGFHSGGNTNAANLTFAPSAVGEPDFVAVPMTRREMRAAGLYDIASDAAAPAAASASPIAAPVALVEPPATRPVTAADAHPVTQSTLAMQVTEIEAELATPVPPLVVTQAPITVIVPVSSPAVSRPALSSPAVSSPPVPTPPVLTAREVEQLDVASIFGLVTSVEVTDLADAPAASLTDAASSRRSRERRATGGRPSSRPAPRAATVRVRSDRKSIRQRVTGLGVILLVPGLFAVLALPAYADNNASSLTSASTVRTQKLAVSDAAATDSTKVSRDSYTATSASDLKSLYSAAIRQQNLAAYMQSGAKSQGDDYPWFAELSRNQGGGLSPLNYYYRECVDFVAWRLNRDAGSTKAPFKWIWSNLTPSGGNASQWKSAWLNHGWDTGTTPKVGAVAWFPYNHVAYVSGILNDGSVALEEYNWQGQHLYSTRIIQPGDAYYLYAPPA